MRFTLLSGRSYADASIGDLTGPPRGEAGAEADDLLADLMGGGPDVNPELTGASKHRVYDEMRKTDPTVKSLLFMPKLAVRSALWGLNPADDTDDVSKVIRDMVAQNLGIENDLGWLDLSWPKSLEQSMTMLDFGPCLEELVWGDVREWYDGDGDPHLVRPLVKLALRPPGTIQRFTTGRNGGLRVEQNIAGARPIDHRPDKGVHKLSHMVFEREGGHWDGVSMLRPAWGAWRLKKFLIVNTGIGWDRFMMGIPKLWHPDTPEGEAVAKTIGRSLRGHQRAYVRFPVPAGGTKDDSEWDLDLLSAAGSLADPTSLLRWCSEQIAEAGLQHFMRQGLGQTGARATAETQANPFYDFCQALAEDIRTERMRQLIRPLVEINFGRQAAEERCPILTVSRIQPRNLEIMAKVIALLSPLGFRFTDREAQDDLRELLGFGRLPEELDDAGVDRARLEEILASVGLTPEQLAAAVSQLPADVGVARNRVEGAGLGL